MRDYQRRTINTAFKINVDNPQKSPTVLSLCTGYGGIEKSLHEIFGAITVLALVEIEAFAITNLVNKMETGKLDPVPIWTDLKTFDARPFRGCVDILTGGYPCQPFSTAGTRNGSKDPRHLWPYIETIIIHARPRQVFLENVEGHLTLGICEVLEDLENLGFRVEAGIFSAAEVGAPHQRKRVFILADAGDRCGDPRENRTGRQEGPDIDRRNERAELEYSEIKNGRLRERETEENALLEFTGFHQWPSRPGEPQHEWEAPRVVADPKNLQRRSIERGTEDGILPKNRDQGEVESGLGRTIDGSRNRVDRLRLLGNGVVPQTAAKAYFILSEKLNGKT